MIDRFGESMTLVRADEVASPLTVKGKRVGGTLDDLGNAAQQTFRVRIGPAELTASAWASKVPAITDLLTVNGRACAVLDVKTLKDGDAVALYELEVGG